jgi:hypothetical protein
MAKKKYNYKGKDYNREELYKLFNISSSKVYDVQKKYKIGLLDSIEFIQMEGMSKLGRPEGGSFKTFEEKYVPKFNKSLRYIINEDEIEIKETICATFGCKNKLSMTEKLYGDRCYACN